MALNTLQLRIRTAINEWLYSCILLDAVQAGRITVDTFPSEFDIRTLDLEGNQVGRVLRFSPPFTPATILDYHQNLIHAATASAATKITAVLEEKFGNNPSRIGDAQTRAAFTIVKRSRHAWSHQPQGPHWDIPVEDRREWTIRDIDLTVDLTNADGKAVSGQDYGGWAGFYDLMVFCEGLAAD